MLSTEYVQQEQIVVQGVFLLVRPKKLQSVRLHVNPFKKVPSVRIS